MKSIAREYFIIIIVPHTDGCKSILEACLNIDICIQLIYNGQFAALNLVEIQLRVCVFLLLLVPSLMLFIKLNKRVFF